MITTQDAHIKLLEYRSIDNKARNRRRNLIFKGIGDYGIIENCFELIQDFINDKLKIPAEMYIERVHRLGRPRPNQTKPHPIIAFRDFGDTELVLERAPNLRGTHYLVTHDFPKEISDARNTLWPEYRKAHENPSSNHVSIRFHARLVVDGVTIQDMFPGWYKVMNGSRVHNSETNCPQLFTSDQPNDFSNGNGTQQSTGGQATRSLSVHIINWQTRTFCSCFAILILVTQMFYQITVLYISLYCQHIFQNLTVQTMKTQSLLIIGTCMCGIQIFVRSIKGGLRRRIP